MDDFSIDFGLNELLLQIALVSAKLHDEIGDRAALLRERKELVEQARACGLWITDWSQPSQA